MIGKCARCKTENVEVLKHARYKSTQYWWCRECNAKQCNNWYHRKGKKNLDAIYLGQLKHLAKKLGYKLIKIEDENL